jgi:hypothetical protein
VNRGAVELSLGSAILKALAKGIRQDGVAAYSTAIESTTKNEGFNYPDFIDKVPYIRPTRAKFLHFFVRGREVFSKGFPNRHVGWWRKVVTQARWSESLRTAQGKVKWPA